MSDKNKDEIRSEKDNIYNYIKGAPKTSFPSEMISYEQSREYRDYRKEELYEEPKNYFERLIDFVDNLFTVNCPDSLRERFEKPLKVSDLRATPDQIFSASIFVLVASFIAIIPAMLLMGFPANVILLGLPPFLVYNIFTYPDFYADVVRIKAGNETVKVILYMVIYLSLNPVFDRAIAFTARHCDGPIGMDLRKIMWNVDMGKYQSVKDAISDFSKKWSDWNEDFVSSLSVLQGIEIESSEERRQETLKKSLDKVLKGTYQQMSQYAKNLRSPVQLLFYLGILLPLLGIVMFPLVSIFLTESVNPVYVAFGYWIVIPALIFWFMHRIISKRPSAFSHSKATGGVKPKKFLSLFDGKINLPILLVSILVGIIIMTPGIFHYAELLSIRQSYTQSEWSNYVQGRYEQGKVLPSMFVSMTVVWGLAVAIVMFTIMRSYDRKQLEDFIRKIEEQFEIGLFQLGDTMKENVPIEVAIPYVLDKYRRLSLEDTEMFSFFRDILKNLKDFGMTFSGALFDEDRGVLQKYPSSIIKDVCKILANSAKKGPTIVAMASRNIVNYLEKVREIEETIKDILDDVISSLKTQTTFIAPFMSAVVGSLSVLIIQFLTDIMKALKKIQEMFGLQDSMLGSAAQSGESLFGIINIKQFLPPTVLQLILGVYLIESIILMSTFLNGINKGFDEVSRDMLIGKNIVIGMILYSIIAFLLVLFFQPIVAQVGSAGNL
ncbi:MAG: hypothetical protein ABEK36_01135 [Candidatus Aenigmatarchaeota archaeon]